MLQLLSYQLSACMLAQKFRKGRKKMKFSNVLTAALVSFLFGIFLGIVTNFSCDDGYERPISVDTPPLLSTPESKWPQHGLDAEKRGLIWGQCGVCGFPVTKEDVRNGFGESIVASSRSHSWEEFVCYRHVI